MSDLLSYQKECSAAFLGSQAEKFLERERGINPETASRFGIGYDSKQQCIVFPYYCPDGSIHRFKLRDKDGQRYTTGKGVIPFGLFTMADRDRVFICEGETDTLRLAQELPEEAVLGIPGAQSIGCLEEYLSGGITLYACFDTDSPGKKATAKAIEKYGAMPVFLPSDVKDVCEYFQDGHTREDFLALVEQADIVHALKDTLAENKEEVAAMPLEAPPVGILMSEVVPERVTWLWAGRIPQGKLAVLDGDPGLGKSTLAFNLAARVSTGHAMPDGSGGGQPGGVVILSAEDGLGDTIRPRLEAAGADLNRIVALTSCPDNDGQEEHPPVLPDDLDWIKKAIERVGAKLVIIDPLMAYLSGDTNSHRDQDIRRVLKRVADLAEETGAAILVIRHLNKMSGGNALYRGGGSIGIIGAARSGLLVARDPDHGEDGEGRVLASQKCNSAAKPESLAFHIEATETNGIPTSRVLWDGASAYDANALLAQVDDGERGALEEAKEVLESILADGRIQADEVKKQYKQAGVSVATATRAKKDLKVKSVHPVIPGPWYWELPRCSNNAQDAQDSPIENLEHLEHLGQCEPEQEELEGMRI